MHGELVFCAPVLGLGNQKGHAICKGNGRPPRRARALRKSPGGSLHSVIYNGARLTVSPGTYPLQAPNH